MQTDDSVVKQRPQISKKLSPEFLWVVAIVIGVTLAMTRIPSVFVMGDVHPLGNDAFYHATRILEIAEDPSSAHSFDANLHWPEGHWIAWPWAYDYLGGVLAGLFSGDQLGAAKIMAFYPLLWLIGSISLVGLIAREILRPGLAALCMLAYAAAPLTVTIFSVGALDHHSAEHFWFLLSLYLTGLWLTTPESSRLSIALGMVLAAATAFHNSLFMLQLLVLTGLFLARLSGHALPANRQATLFGVSLVVTQLLVLLPSHHFLTFAYAFYLLSWFQLHVALLTAIGVFALCNKSDRVMWSVLLVAVVLALPTAVQVMFGMNYVNSQLPMFNSLQETQPMFGGSLSLLQINYFFTGLVWLLPVYVAYTVFQLYKRRVQGMTLIVMMTSLFGFALMLAQFRFHYFGYLFLLIIPLLIIQQLLPRGRDILIAGLLISGAYAYSISYYLIPIKLGDSPRYAFNQPLINSVRTQCEKQPGLLLADNDWGNFLRYRTQCPIYANNFILTRKEVDYINLSLGLFQKTPAQLRQSAPDVRYVMVNQMDLNPLSEALLSDEVFEGFTVIGEQRHPGGKVLGRLYGVEPK